MDRREPTFNPPNLTGQVSERTALDAMIAHSDDTATDIVLTQVGADNVRQLLASAGLQHTLIADTTRSFFGYLKGAADYETFTWDQLVATANDPFVEAPLNTTITFASSADDLVSFYEQAMRGDFFEHDETLKVLRSLMSTGDVVWALPLPLGPAPSAGRLVRRPRVPRAVHRRARCSSTTSGCTSHSSSTGPRRRPWTRRPALRS